MTTLNEAPPDLVHTRDALHQLAYFAVSPARYRKVGRMGLRPTHGGFGTPEFEGQVARVEGTLLVHETAAGVATQEISTVREAARFLGGEYEVGWFTEFRDPLQPADPDAPLAVGVVASGFIADWFAYGWEVLEKLQGQAIESDDVSEVQLWPEHFDPAVELGDQERGRRASYGASPGDRHHDEPYLYVAAWGEIDRSIPYWNDEAFNGSSLPYRELLDSADPVERALDFLLQGYGVLHTG
ncbi:MAG TPA: hypothetical protein VFS66_15545 [Acidimicrobiia bacterium]|nr:hypothetical protein [Acidimicrobiia bacterium]